MLSISLKSFLVGSMAPHKGKAICSWYLSSHYNLLLWSLCRYQRRVSNIIDDVLDWSPSLALSGMMEKQQNVANATGSPDASSQGSETGPEHTAPTDDDNDAKTFTEQYNTEEVNDNVEDAGEEDKQHD